MYKYRLLLMPVVFFGPYFTYHLFRILTLVWKLFKYDLAVTLSKHDLFIPN